MRSYQSKQAFESPESVLLLGYGSPGSLEDIPAYLQNIKNGQVPSQNLIDNVRERYEKIGGQSPLLAITTRIAEKLSQKIKQPVYVGMRHWHPFINEVIPKMIADGVREITAVCLAPHYSELSVGAYQTRVEDTMSGVSSPVKVNFVRQWPDQKDYLEGLEVNTRLAISRFPSHLRENIKIIFTAHSLPVTILESGDPYHDQVLKTASLLADRLALPAHSWQLAYQSAPRKGDGWIGPQINQVIDKAAVMGERNIIICPIGFLVDHLEVLYDLDIETQGLADTHGIHLERTPMLNDSPFLVDALLKLVNMARQRK